MPIKNVVPALLPVPRFRGLEDEAHLPHARKIFALRDIHFRDIKAVGFDMDYTLSHYRSPEIDELAFRKSSQLLVRERGYDERLLGIPYDPEFAIRGLVLDGLRGNLLKLNTERMVVRACHGSQPMEREAIDAAYGRRRLAASAKGFRSIDTLFEIPESYLYAVMVDGKERGWIAGKDCLELFHDVRWAIDTAHRNGDMKAEILANREFYILQDPELAAALDRWKRAGKKLFVVSNSEWHFTNGVLSFLLDGQDPARPSWEDYFDLVVTSSRKPIFFEEPQPALPTEGHPKAFTGSNAGWLENQLQAFGEEILYVGDHIYGDILRSKKSVSWQTLLLIPELGATLQRLEDLADDLQLFLRTETQRRRSEIRVSLLEDKLTRNREHRHILAARLSPEALQALDLEAGQLRDERDSSQERLMGQETSAADLGTQLEAAFNSRWGSIFRDGYQQTRFADQIQQYASAYTGRISNLYLVDPTVAIYAPVPTLPHERI
jgi:HAD superfamily 5'-nucleotidase-like hydrolase